MMSKFINNIYIYSFDLVVLCDVIFSIISGLICIILILICVAYFTLLERKILGGIQRRRGPNYYGFFGILQPLADAIKLASKDVVIPYKVNILLFLFTPMFTFFISLITWTVAPFGFYESIGDVQYSILFIIAVSSLGAYGVIFSGWSSNSKYSYLGSIRAISQIISYELSFGCVFVLLVFFNSSARLLDLALNQSVIWIGSFLCIFYILFFITGLAETNRIPFDLPEAEAELVAGYNVEYSALFFALFFLAEYSNMLFFAFLSAVCFLGGWFPLFGVFSGSFILAIKIVLQSSVVIWVRGMLPRLRYDQLLDLNWKRFLPLLFGGLIFYTTWFDSCVVYVKYVTIFMASCLIAFVISETIRLWIKATLKQWLLIVIALVYKKATPLLENFRSFSPKFIQNRAYSSHIKHTLQNRRTILLYMKSSIGYYSITFAGLLYAMLLFCMFLSDMQLISTVCISSQENTSEDTISDIIESFNKFYEGAKAMSGFTNLSNIDHKKCLIEFLSRRLIEGNYSPHMSDSEIRYFMEKLELLNNANESSKRGGFLFLLFGTNAKYIHSYFSKVYRNPSLFGVVSIFVYLVLAIVGAYFINYFIKTGADNLVHYLDTCISQYGKYGARSIEQSIYAAIGDFSTFECMFLDDCCISWSESDQRQSNLRLVRSLMEEYYERIHYTNGSICSTDYWIGNVFSIPVKFVCYCMDIEPEGFHLSKTWPWLSSSFDKDWSIVQEGVEFLLDSRIQCGEYRTQLLPEEISFIENHCREYRRWYIGTRSVPFFGSLGTLTGSYLMVEYWPSAARTIVHFIVDVLLKFGPAPSS